VGGRVQAVREGTLTKDHDRRIGDDFKGLSK
jgi:hypothetical protein